MKLIFLFWSEEITWRQVDLSRSADRQRAGLIMQYEREKELSTWTPEELEVSPSGRNGAESSDEMLTSGGSIFPPTFREPEQSSPSTSWKNRYYTGSILSYNITVTMSLYHWYLVVVDEGNTNSCSCGGVHEWPGSVTRHFRDWPLHLDIWILRPPPWILKWGGWWALVKTNLLN